VSIVDRRGEGQVDSFYFRGDDGGAGPEADVEELEQSVSGCVPSAGLLDADSLLHVVLVEA